MSKKQSPNRALEALQSRLGGSKLHTTNPSPKSFPADIGTDGDGHLQLLETAAPESAHPLVHQGFRQYVGQIVEVPVELLRVKDNVRTIVEEDDSFEDLVSTIQDNEIGLIQNLLVNLTVLQDGVEDLVIISGQRRWMASKRAGKKTVLCKIAEGLDPKKRKFLGIIENVVRKDLAPIELASAFHDLAHNLGATQDEIAKEARCSRKNVQRYLGLMTWPPEAIDLLRKHPSVFSTDFLFNGISSDIKADPDLLVMRLRKKVEQANGSDNDNGKRQAAKPQAPADSVVSGWNQTARDHLGVPVTMSGSRENLRITIRCAGEENVKKLLEKFGVSVD